MRSFLATAALLAALVAAVEVSAGVGTPYAGTQGTGASTLTLPVSIQDGFPQTVTATSINVTTSSASILLVGLVGNGSSLDPNPVTVSGGGLTWTQIDSAFVAYDGGSALFWAYSNAAISPAITITPSFTNSVTSLRITVWSLTGANTTSPVGSHTTDNANSGPVDVTLTNIQAAGSRLFLAGQGEYSTSTRTTISGTTNDYSETISYFAHGTSTTTSGDVGNSLTIGYTAPTIAWSHSCAAEIKPQ